MLGFLTAVDRYVYAIADYNKNNTDKSRQGFRDHLETELNIKLTQQTVNRWLSSVEINHHLPAYALAAFVNYYRDPDNNICCDWVSSNKINTPRSMLPLSNIAFKAGYVLRPFETPKIQDDIQTFFKAVTHNQKESADVIATAAAAMEDGALDKKELQKVKQELLEQLGAVSVLMSMVDKGLGE